MSGRENEWQRAWAYIDARRTVNGWSWSRLYAEAEVSQRTLTKMRHEGVGLESPSKRASLCKALGWSPDSIERILDGGDPYVLDAPLLRQAEAEYGDAMHALASGAVSSDLVSIANAALKTVNLGRSIEGLPELHAPAVLVSARENAVDTEVDDLAAVTGVLVNPLDDDALRRVERLERRVAALGAAVRLLLKDADEEILDELDLDAIADEQ